MSLIVDKETDNTEYLHKFSHYKAIMTPSLIIFPNCLFFVVFCFIWKQFKSTFVLKYCFFFK